MINNEQIEKLRAEYDFKSDYSLEEELNELIQFCDSYPNQSPRLNDDIDKLISPIQKLLEVYDELPEDRLEYLITGCTESWKLLYERFPELSKLVDELKSIRSSVGRPSNTSRNFLIFKLKEIYREGTGKTDKYTYNAITGKVANQKMIGFIKNICDIIKLNVSTNIISDTLKKDLYGNEAKE